MRNIAEICNMFSSFIYYLLNSQELQQLGHDGDGLSCRDIKELCETTERRFASRILRENNKSSAKNKKGWLQWNAEPPSESQPLPPFSDYLESVKQRVSQSRPGQDYGEAAV